jgi:hypothetical protein
MTRFDLLRYLTWALMAQTADANRRHYRMATAWTGHFAWNTIALLLPDVLRWLLPRRPKALIPALMARMIRDNERYVLYVFPLAAGYILSHPRFNIYKGRMAELRAAGFGLDAIPHSLTALGLTLLVYDSVQAVESLDNGESVLSPLVDFAGDHLLLTTFAGVALPTALWESIEYFTHRYEMAQRGSAELINMQWSVDDTAHDVASNFAGWALGLWLRERFTRGTSRLS